jgi:hypothetical protein
MVLYPTPNGEEPPPLPPPSDFSLAYDENSGVVNLTWSRVTDARLLKYGIRRVDVDAGGGAQEFAVNDTTYPDVPFASGDSVQMKTLLYSVYSLKRDPGGYSGASRSQSLRLEARRPWAYGPRIDSIVRADTGRTYRPGDTVRIIASWANRIRGNDSLFWRVGGPSPFVLARAHPPASGADTLAFALPAAGDYPISLTLKDAEGYRSWLSVPFRF